MPWTQLFKLEKHFKFPNIPDKLARFLFCILGLFSIIVYVKSAIFKINLCIQQKWQKIHADEYFFVDRVLHLLGIMMKLCS